MELPVGVKDFLPEEARAKRQMENDLAELFRRWGYREVVTPTFEYYQTLTPNGWNGEEDYLFKFIDRQGRILALRYDMTMPIARLVSMRLRSEPLPLRLYYLANVFRYETPQAGRQREFYQAGVELIGARGPAADAEVIALAVEALEATGLPDFKVGIGQVEVIKGILEDIALPSEGIRSIKQAIARKDHVGLEQALEQYGVSEQDRRLLITVSNLHGSIEVLDRAFELVESERARKALQELRQVFEVLEGYGVSGRIFLDLGILRDFDYYTGTVFEGYVAGLGFPICGGGRYDHLLGKFGYACPATGFALGVERVMMALKNIDREKPTGIRYLVCGSPYGKVLEKARELREKGYSVEVDLLGLSPEEIADYAKKRGIGEVIWVGEEAN